MQQDEPGAAAPRAMLKSYKKVSRWYPALDPAADAPDANGDTGFGVEDLDPADGLARYPHYITDDEPELDIPPLPESVLRRSHFSGAWSDWMTDRESDSYTPRLRYRASTVLEFPSEADEPGAAPYERAREFDGDADQPVDRASALLDALDRNDSAAGAAERSTGRRLFAIAFLIVAVLLLAVAGGIALYVLNSHSGTAQSLGTLYGATRFGPSDGLAAYNEMTAPR
ncbi:hypothetical protein [Nocardia huaxiensis]|uniref:Uncharacterized protein n=1 Tax=Nocardia huaxiensis TaxID=2755382 RepID=A0A7D6VBR6_9NOCA|nr:hypothetical protein [Nocardia huaxiensis]QLY29117.1 hypothetical protein H0264_28000 [Nocardia huaxiensis]UFS97390.1 hypothetical protein LPY97_05600 [Nocardia huaxiensis]